MVDSNKKGVDNNVAEAETRRLNRDYYCPSIGDRAKSRTGVVGIVTGKRLTVGPRVLYIGHKEGDANSYWQSVDPREPNGQ